MFDTVLVANRGEIAVRVIRTVRAMGVRSVAVYSDADADARHVRDADVAVRLGPAPATQSYLSIQRILDAAACTGVQAVHPGYGFLSEHAAFARACADAGLVFIGPPAGAMEAMGDKIRAKTTVAAAGVPVVPGSDGSGCDDSGCDGSGCDDDALAAAAAAIGYPVLLKPSAGGGGKGMRVVHHARDLPEAIASARREARGAFSVDTLLVERLVATPRHIEIQVLADTHGAVVHLGERECSLQRRHQKIVEEAPSVLLDAATRARMGECAVAVARAVGYTGAGTVEFLVPAQTPDQFFFLEMNTRLQVEHPVTELVTGIDLVEQQFRIAAGDPPSFDPAAVVPSGHALELRIYAEDPVRFLPGPGTITQWQEPSGEGTRVDAGYQVGNTVTPFYDPLMAKLCVHGADRAQALDRARQAVAAFKISGPKTNLAFHAELLATPQFVSGDYDTSLISRMRPS